VENEYWYAKKGEPQYNGLKTQQRSMVWMFPLYCNRMGRRFGSPVEVIPLWGGYADEPWIESVHKNDCQSISG
jgi:hypothetical protein